MSLTEPSALTLTVAEEPLPPPTPEEAAAEAAEDAALEKLQALKPGVRKLLADARETTTHPDAPGAEALKDLSNRLGTVTEAVDAATHPDDPVAAILRGQYDEWLAEASDIITAWAEGKRPARRAPMMGH